MRSVYNAKEINVSGPYSHAVDSGHLIFLSGQTAMNQTNFTDQDADITTQTKIAFKNLKQVMEAAGINETDLVKVNVYLLTMDDFEEMNAVYQTELSAPYPARTCVAVAGLPLGARVEIEAIARKK